MSELFEKARAVREHAYAPYSQFKVGAAIRSASGKIFIGCNVENAAYPEGVCAEAGAISAMIAGGETKISEICIVADTSQPIAPCGGCRQKLAEFSTPETEVILAGSKGEVTRRTVGDLLPESFGPAHLSD
jgi:cytidine deaminase